jgi:hypothetical protein
MANSIIRQSERKSGGGDEGKEKHTRSTSIPRKEVENKGVNDTCCKLFSKSLPSLYITSEREEIFEIHLAKEGWKAKKEKKWK